MAKKYKCPYCEDRLIRKDLIDHIDKEHEEFIPDGTESAQIVYDIVNNTKGAGRCRVCGSPTKWNFSAKRYDVLCENPRCKQKMREEYQKNMLRVHGTYNILNDDEQQKKMLANRSISGKYKFTDGGVVTYTGSYEKKFLEFADKVMQIPSKDIMGPGPTLEYEMNGEKHFYITDFLYIPYNLIIEVKDGGSNPNNKNSEGMKSSRQRTIEKEKLITDRGEYNYLRLTDNQFVQLLEIFMEIKKALLEGNEDKIIKINESDISNELYINEAREIDNRSEFDYVTDIFTGKSYRNASSKIEVDKRFLSQISAYHLEPKIKAKGKKVVHAVWDEELYSKDITSAIINDIKSNRECKNYDEVHAYVYTTGKNLRPVYLGTILIFDKDNPYNFKWVERVYLDKDTYDYLIKHPIDEATDINNFYEEDYEYIKMGVNDNGY